MRRYELEELDLSEKGRTKCHLCPLHEHMCTLAPKGVNSHLHLKIDCSCRIVKRIPNFEPEVEVIYPEIVYALSDLMNSYKEQIKIMHMFTDVDMQTDRAYKQAQYALENAILEVHNNN